MYERSEEALGGGCGGRVAETEEVCGMRNRIWCAIIDVGSETRSRMRYEIENEQRREEGTRREERRSA